MCVLIVLVFVAIVFVLLCPFKNYFCLLLFDLKLLYCQYCANSRYEFKHMHFSTIPKDERKPSEHISPQLRQITSAYSV